MTSSPHCLQAHIGGEWCGRRSPKAVSGILTASEHGSDSDSLGSYERFACFASGMEENAWNYNGGHKYFEITKSLNLIKKRLSRVWNEDWFYGHIMVLELTFKFIIYL